MPKIDRTTGYGDNKLHLETYRVGKGHDDDRWRRDANIEETLQCLCEVVTRLCDAMDKIPEAWESGESTEDTSLEELRDKVSTVERDVSNIWKKIGLPTN